MGNADNINDHAELIRTNVPEPYKSYIDVIGLENFQQLIEKYGGRKIYIPKPGLLERIVTDYKIRNEYNGKNISELSRKYGLTRRTIYKILEDRNGIGGQGSERQ